MSKTSQDPTKYYRAGIAIPLSRKPELQARLKALGLNTLGELASLFILMPGVVEALKPLADKFNTEQGQNSKAAQARKLALVAQLKLLSPEEIQAIVAQASETAAAVEQV